MSAIERRYEWHHEGSDPNDETFGHVVEPVSLDDSLGHVPAVLVGEPYDGAVIGRKGAAAAPAAIRRELQGIKTHHLERGAVPAIGDIGDLSIPADRVERAQDAVEERTRTIHERNALPVFLGGDNSLTVPNVSPLLDSGSVGVISIDAHLDCRTTDDGASSGTPYRQLHNRGLDSLAVIGARPFETSTTYVEYLREQDGTIVTAEAVRQDLSDAVETARDALAAVEQVYVSLDVDAIDGAAAPGVSAPTPGGITSREAFELLAQCCFDDRIAGVEVVECAPPLDRGDRTVRIASRAVAHAISAAVSGTDPNVGGNHNTNGGSSDD